MSTRPAVGRRLVACLFAGLLPLLATLPACSPKHRQPDRDPFALPGDRARADGIIHAVGSGESWASIALDYYGEEGEAGRLRRANRHLGTVLPPDGEIFVPLDEGERRAFERRARSRAPYNKGLSLARAGDFPEAIIQFREALSLDPDLAPAHYNLGLVYRRSGQLEAAETHLSRACKLRRREPAYHYAWGGALAELGRPRRAQQRYRTALDADPDHLPSLYALARSLEDRGDAGGAQRYWRRYLRLDPDSLRGREARQRLGLQP